ncbi:ER to Golgi transport membrane [Tubulinosema ratisbonensis]|uniref:Protein transport protein SFT2 n=1 Tax=Tubulinosema ratisbonensis TaxID=291195 RepID=A0A437AP58_9MICR|nr:ER to Golgi transport membrane [Tubulinosema ratisbonensis]
MKYTELENALNMNDSLDTKFSIPFTKNDLFKKRSIDLEHFNMTFSQRMLAFFFCLAIGMVTMAYSFFNILGAVTSPIRFALPYAISNYFFFLMFGFIFGFKTYFKKVFRGKKRNYTVAFMACTFLTIYAGYYVKSYFLHLFLCLGQIVTFVAFVIALVPGGSDGLSSIIKLLLKR